MNTYVQLLIATILFASTYGQVYAADNASNSEICVVEMPLLTPTVKSAESLASDHEGWKEIIAKFAPIFHLHPKEQAYPVTAEQYFTSPHTSLIDTKSNETIVPPGQLSMKEIFQIAHSDIPTNRTLTFQNPECIKKGSSPTVYRDSEGNLNTPIYAYAFEGERDGKKKLYIQYFLLFADNPAYNTPIAPMGGHTADLEHVTVELDREGGDYALDRVYMDAHGREGVWYDAKSNEMTTDRGHPVGYIALGGHGVYPKFGTYVCIFGFAEIAQALGRDGIRR